MRVYNNTASDFDVQGQTILAGGEVGYAVPVADQVDWAKDSYLRAAMTSQVIVLTWEDPTGEEIEYTGMGGVDMLKAIVSGNMTPQDVTGE